MLNSRQDASNLESLQLNCDKDYSQLLQSFGLTPTIKDPWAIVGRTPRIQGWKLHISTTPAEATMLFTIVIKHLLNVNVSTFKIVKDEWTLGALNEGDLGETQVGKAMTIYPADDEEAYNLAQQLAFLTKSFHGPIVISDLRLGDVLYARYGGFNPIIQRDRLGLLRLMIYGKEGSLHQDEYTVPFLCPPEVDNIFHDWSFQSTWQQVGDPIHQLNGKQTELFGPGYLAIDVIRRQAKGNIFLAMDLRSQDKVAAKIIKQGKQYCMTDKEGRDIRNRLQRQQELHHFFADKLSIPKADCYFEVKGDGYLPIEWLEGQSLESLAMTTLKGHKWINLSVEIKERLLGYFAQVLHEVKKLHDEGFVHRDLAAANIWITVDDKVYLLDLELCHSVNDLTPAFGLGTMGFMSPQQANRQLPDFADDIFTLGCVLSLLITGLDPRRVVSCNDSDLFRRLSGLTGAPSALLNIIIACVRENPQDRLTLNELHHAIQQQLSVREAEKLIIEQPVPLNIEEIIAGGLCGILENGVVHTHDGLWLSVEVNGSHQMQQRFNKQVRLRMSANKGISGVVYALSRLSHLGYCHENLAIRVNKAIDWLMNSMSDAPDAGLPGLHFGAAGVAVALSEAISTGLITRTDVHLKFIQKLFIGLIDWPDITHGAAGQGIAAFYVNDIVPEINCLSVAHQAAKYLMDTQRADGSWQMPAGVNGMSGEIITGFAHGVAGIIYFLVEYNKRTGDNRSKIAYEKATNWLIKQAIEENGLLEWPYSTTNPNRWQWWCHGGPGIAITYLKLYEETQSSLYAEHARKALSVHPSILCYPNLTQCHGLSGLGEIYMEAYRILGEDIWYQRATNLVETLVHLGRRSPEGVISWLAEDANVATADLMVGSSGILHFLMRYRSKGQEFGIPLLLGLSHKY